MAQIHSTAIVDKQAELAEDVHVGPYAIIEAGTKIGAGTTIFAQAYIAKGTTIGEKCRVFQGAVLGNIPQDLKFDDEETELVIGDRTTIREFVTLNRGTVDYGKTKIGSDCLLMSYTHVAHDCQIGDRVILANAVNIAGHVVIEDWASIGGMTPIHQFVRIGAHSFIGGGYRVPKDVPPYILATGEPLRFAGLNSVGLQRRGFKPEQLTAIKRTYRYIYRANLNFSQALEIIETKVEQTPEVKHIIKFISESDRGVMR